MRRPMLLVLFLALPALSAHAKGRPAPVLDLVAVRVDVRVEGTVATTSIEHVYRNRGRAALELDLLLPIPPGAAVTEYGLRADDRSFPAEMLPRDEAKRAYTETVRRLQDPALLKHAGQSAVRARAFPVPAGAERTIRLTYSQVLAPVDGLTRVALVPAPDRVEHDRIGSLEVRATVRSATPLVGIWSPTHALEVRRTDARSATAVHRSERARAGDELVLYAAVSPGEVGLTLLPHRVGAEDGYFLLLGAPGEASGPAPRAERTVLFVVDRSGSMKGEKVEQVKGALRFCLNSLAASDRFNLITFGNDVTPLFDAPRPAAAGTVAAALEAVAAVQADGGTAIQDALLTALDHVPREGSTDLVFLTDGLPTVGERDPAKILRAVADRNEGRARVFTFGVGYDVNVTFLDRMALAARGFPTVVRPREDVEVAVSAFFRAITEPALTDLRIEAEGVELIDLYPKDLPSLFRGSGLSVLGRYRGHGQATVVLHGRQGSTEKAYSFRMRFPEQEPGADFLPALWAARRIGHLVDDVRARGPEPGLVDEVVALARRHGVVTEYTAFLVDLDTSDPAEIRRRAVQAFDHAGRVEAGAWAHSQARNKEAQKRAESADRTTGYEDAEGRWTDFSGRVARIDGRVFLRAPDGTWVDTAIPAGAPVAPLAQGSEAYTRMVASSDAFARVAALGAPILVRWEGTIFRIE